MTVSTTLELLKYATDASPSWNGYNHQGKVGIFVVLKKINEYKLSIEMCKEYDLEFEWLEDFSIKKNDKYLEIHQVKTYNATAPSTYKDAIWLLLAKSLDFPDIQKSYLHSTSKISKLNNLQKTIFSYEPPKDSASQTDADEDTDVQEKPKKYWTPKQCHDYVKETGQYEQAFKKFAIYTYEEDYRHCSMHDIENKIKIQLNIFYDNRGTGEQLERAYLRLLGLVDKHIRERHITIQEKNGHKAPIAFQNFFKLITENYEIPSKSYIIFKLRDRFSRLTNEFLEELDIEEQEGTYSDKKNLYSVINSVMKLDDEAFFKFCMKISPHKEFREENSESILEALSNFISETHITEGYLEILKQVRREIDSEKYTYFKKDAENLNISYLPTAIIDSHNHIRVGKMVEKILQNSALIDEALHEIDVLITKHINLKALKIENVTKDFPEIEKENSGELNFNVTHTSKIESTNYNNRISKIKKIRMVDIERAKGELDE